MGYVGLVSPFQQFFPRFWCCHDPARLTGRDPWLLKRYGEEGYGGRGRGERGGRGRRVEGSEVHRRVLSLLALLSSYQHSVLVPAAVRLVLLVRQGPPWSRASCHCSRRAPGAQLHLRRPRLSCDWCGYIYIYIYI